MIVSCRTVLWLACFAAMVPVLGHSADPFPSVIHGQRRSLAVHSLDVTQNFISQAGADAAALIQAALIKKLDDAGCCKVVDAAQQPVSGAPPPSSGDVAPAEYIVRTYVTIDPPPDLGHHVFDGPPDRRRGSVEIDVRFSDARSGLVLNLFQAERKISATDLATGDGDAGTATSTFFARPLGQATDLALADIVSQIAGALATRP